MKLALAGDTMLGRGVAERIAAGGARRLFAPEVVAAAAEADLFVLNLECCISERGAPGRGRVFHFRAPPAAVEALATLGVDCVTLANNHALDFGPEALLDTFALLDSAGIAWVGAGWDRERARTPAVLLAGDRRLGVIGMADHPERDAAARDRPGIAYADLRGGHLPEWPAAAVRELEADAVLVTPHWGPNMRAEPVAHVLLAASALVEAGATLVAGHSAHVFHGFDGGGVLYDLGDFVDDYRVDRQLRNDLGLLVLVDLDGDRLEAVPLKLEVGHTRLAAGDDLAWIVARLRDACAAFGTEVAEEDGRLVARWR